MEVLFDPVWNWPLTAAMGVLLVAVVLVTYPPRIRHLPAGSRRLMLSLRLLSALALVFAMLRPAVQFEEKDPQGARLVMLMDASRSMGTPDTPGGNTRREALKKLIVDQRERLDRIAEQVDLQWVDFADESTAASPAPSLEGEGRFTAIGRAIDDIRKQESARRLVGVVMLSDGAQRASGELDVDPRAAARRFAEQSGAPIYTVPLGSSDLSGGAVDLLIEDVVVDPFPFERKTVPVRGFVRAVSASGRKAVVRLSLEDRSERTVGETGEFRPLVATAESRPVREFEIGQGVTRIPFDLSFVAPQAGDYKLRCEVVPLADEPRELKVSNNRFETLVTVRKGGLKVMYFDVLRHEAQFINRLQRNAQVQLDWVVIPAGSMQRPDSVSDDLFKAGRFDVYIIGDVPASVFGPPEAGVLKQLAQRVNGGAGLLMTGGEHNFGAGGYSQTPLADLIPVQMGAGDVLRPGQNSSRNQLTGPIQMQPTREGLAHFVMQVAGPEQDQATVWQGLAPMNGATRLQPLSGVVDVLATQAGQPDVPLLFAQDTGRGRTMAFAGDSTYRWYLQGQRAVHQRFWEQVLLWLARQENQSDQPVWITVDPRNFAPGATAPFRFGAQNAQKQPLKDVTFALQVLTPSGEKKTVPAQKIGDEWFAEFSGTTEPGDYWVTATAQLNGSLYGLPASTRFIVDARDPELDNPAADPDLMNEIATLTGASVIQPEQFGDFLDRLLKEGIAAELVRHSTVTLWDGWPFLLVFTTLLSTEWFVRKRRGLV